MGAWLAPATWMRYAAQAGERPGRWQQNDLMLLGVADHSGGMTLTRPGAAPGQKVLWPVPGRNR